MEAVVAASCNRRRENDYSRSHTSVPIIVLPAAFGFGNGAVVMCSLPSDADHAGECPSRILGFSQGPSVPSDRLEPSVGAV
jgi:hypothetical protein